MRPLLLAEACNPEWVSTPLVGWQIVRALRELVGGHLVTQVRNRDALVRAGLVEGKDFTSIDSERVARRGDKLARLLGSKSNKSWTTRAALAAFTYPYFEKRVWREFGGRIESGEFDVVHRITPSSPVVPSPLAGWCRRAGRPMVIGPLNGGLAWPKGFEFARREDREWLSPLRGLRKLLPGYGAMRRNAAALLIGSISTMGQERAEVREKCFYIPENGIDVARFGGRRTRRAARPIRVVFVGRLVAFKMPGMLLEAAAELIRGGEMTLEIIGEGPMRGELEKIIERDEIGAGARLVGWVDHGKLPQKLAEMDLLAFPSIREFGGGVVLEAMAMGLPALVVNYGGPGELVTEKTGFLIPMGTPDEVRAALRAKLSELAKEPGKIDAKAAAARRRAHVQFSWEEKARQIAAVYEWVCGTGLKKPVFEMPTPDLKEEPSPLSSPWVQGDGVRRDNA